MGRSILLLVLQLLLVTVLVSSQEDSDTNDNSYWRRHHGHQKPVGRPPTLTHDGHRDSHAICHVMPNSQLPKNETSISGNIYFRRQEGDTTGILLDLHGFSSSRKLHGIHIHEFGDLTRGCETLGGHYNPHHRRHGSHAGDLGNFRPNATGNIYQTKAQRHLHLHGPHSIIGRSVVIHENEDDMGVLDMPGSAEHGNAGLRLACCVIGVSSQRSWPQE
ncbi:uncharacterized protein LOC132380781 isoform X2 [Hypanus sabinus]|uniref:uncharacterized protein LOC132380781 isoform X2 n=1 Tax=Hypanus sabinus TaxID=79690 RepID=UPI0028C3A0DB|nr:uncharacterized protein LOC132380781 isoform X2 [Hypanus sabinus]